MTLKYNKEKFIDNLSNKLRKGLKTLLNTRGPLDSLKTIKKYLLRLDNI